MELCIGIITFVVVGIFFVFLILLFGLWLDYSVERDDPKIKFDSFKKFYEINPQRWNLMRQGVKCYTDEYRIYGDIFSFGFWDWLKYIKWKDTLEKHEAEQSNAKLTAKMIAAVKQDIASFESLGQQQQDMAVNNIKDIVKNLSGGK